MEAPRKDQDIVEKDLGVSLEKEVSTDAQSDSSRSYMLKIKSRFPWYKLAISIFVGAFFTAWWLSILIQDRTRPKWLIPTVFYWMLMIRLITLHTRILPWVFSKCQYVWYFVTERLYKLMPQRYQRLLVGATVTVAVMLVGGFVPTETEFSKRQDRAVSFFGIVVAIAGLYLTSNNRSKINWNTVIGGMLMQFIVALFVLRTSAGYDIFNFISVLARELLGFAKEGVAFLTNHDVANMGMFFFAVLPSVAFFVAFVHIWYYFGVIQWAIGKFAYFFFWSLKVSGAESVAAAASPFIGIGESAVLIKDLMPLLTKAELHQVMTSGFSTISGAVLVGYIGLGLNAEALVTSCVMSIPASLAVSKLRYPETEEPVTAGKFQIQKSHDENDPDKPQNVLQAFSQGATLGIRIAGTMLAQCLCIIALVYLFNGILTWFGNFWGINHFSLELILSYIIYPISFLLGTPRNEVYLVSKLLATKFIQNEYVSYTMMMTQSPYKDMSKRGILIATYAMCGFSNLGSMGITLGVLNTLTQGSRSADVASTIFSALISGGISTSISAAIAGMLIHDLGGYNLGPANNA
ncbi:uncharacterized protein CANTADRAFT_57965 [Suhomyces tanzawaensis NRRL Y-17324]|uniref:H+/nucleoside cotransporter n=1 Tax=Suhomyces tanzawaensis NRRL Y-17324 TaxID=984487 RepID=A0A1E4SAT2_9ASCO|nr:uncharacterized protein CANTADRAFT_57965 [Suhomyces tanzawaensis NRRL Y-17324]ODV76614.1 hypothetical protein CANTADRAFT_57965 [Suhomyces tanzawaensis NRRL Y-17324]